MTWLLFIFSVSSCVSPLTPYTPGRPLWSSSCPSNTFCFLPRKTCEHAFPFIWKPSQPFLPPQNYSFCSIFNVSSNTSIFQMSDYSAFPCQMLFHSLQSFFVAVMFCKYLLMWIVWTCISHTGEDVLSDGRHRYASQGIGYHKTCLYSGYLHL